MYVINSIFIGLLITLYLISFYFKIGYKNILCLVLLFPFFLYSLNQIVDFKFKSRDAPTKYQNDKILNSVLSRLSISQNLAYIIQNQKKLGQICFEGKYSNPYEVALIQIVPKQIFGIENPKNVSNCVLNYYIGKPIDHSSVKTSLAGNLIIALNKNIIFFVFYLLFVIFLIGLIIVIFNYLLGNKSMIFNFFILWNLVAEGGALNGMVWVIYFGLTMILFFKLMQPFYKYNAT